MKSILKRTLSVILTLAMLLSLVSVPAFAEDDSRYDKIALSFSFTNEPDDSNSIWSIDEGEDFKMLLRFSCKSKTTRIHGYDLLIRYDGDKIAFPKGNDSVIGYSTTPTFNHEFTSGVAYAGWASKEGIPMSSDIFFAVEVKAKTALTGADLSSIRIINNATNGTLTQYTQITDADGEQFEYEFMPSAAGGGGGPEKTEIKESDFTFDLRDREYTGREIKPEVESDLREGTDYEVTYSDNIEVGTAKITVTGIGDYTGTITKTFRIIEIEEEIIPAKSLKFASSKLTIYENNDYDLGEKLTISPEDNNDIITWTSSNEDVVMVDENGVLTAVSMGSAKITAKAVNSGKSATCTVTVARLPEWIELEGDNAVAQGKTITLKAAAYYYDEIKNKDVKTKDVISWRVDDEDVATVSGGKVKGISAGMARITAYIEGTDLERHILVEVIVPAKSVEFEMSKLDTFVGEEFSLWQYLTVTPEDNSDEIIWTSSNEDVVTVNSRGRVTIVGEGTAKIIAKAVLGGKSDYITITAEEPEFVFEEYEFEVEETDEGITTTGENLYINCTPDGEVTVTVTGIAIEDSYITDRESSEENDGEYNWEVVMFDLHENAYSVSTTWWAFEPGAEEERTLDDMDTSVWKIHGNNGEFVGSARVSYTDDSITWTFTFPAGHNFYFEDAKRYEFNINGTLNDEYVERVYTQRRPGSGDGGGSTPGTGGSGNPDVDDPIVKEYNQYVFKAGSNVILTDDTEYEANYEVISYNDVIFCDARSLGEVFGCEVSYEHETRTITFEKDGNIVCYEQDDNFYAVIDGVSYIYVEDFLLNMFEDKYTIVSDCENVTATRNESAEYTYRENYAGSPLRISWKESDLATENGYVLKFAGYNSDISTSRTVTGLAPVLMQDSLVNGELSLGIYTGPNRTNLSLLYPAEPIGNIALNDTVPEFEIVKDEAGSYKFVSDLTGGMWVYRLYDNQGDYYYVNNDINGAIDSYTTFGEGCTVKARYVTWVLNEDKTYAEFSVSGFASYTYNEDASDDEVTGNITLVQDGNSIYATWESTGAPWYYFEIVDSDGRYVTSGGTNGDENVSGDLSLYLPRATENTTYSLVVYGADENYNITDEIARLDDCIEITVSGAPVDYSVSFHGAREGVHLVTVDPLPQGIKLLDIWYKADGKSTGSLGSSSITRLQTTHQTIQHGYSYDLRVLTEYELDGQTIKATMSPESKSIYIEEEGEKIKWSESGVISWKEPENASYYNLNVYSGEGVDVDNFITYKYIRKGNPIYYFDASFNIADLIDDKDGTLTVELVAYNSANEVVEVVGILTVVVSFTEYTPEYDVDITGTKTYTITFAEDTPDGMRYMEWFDSYGNSVGGRSGFGHTALTKSETRPFAFEAGDVLNVYIVTQDSVTDTVWSVARTPVATWAYTAE